MEIILYPYPSFIKIKKSRAIESTSEYFILLFYSHAQVSSVLSGYGSEAVVKLVNCKKDN